MIQDMILIVSINLAFLAGGFILLIKGADFFVKVAFFDGYLDFWRVVRPSGLESTSVCAGRRLEFETPKFLAPKNSR